MSVADVMETRVVTVLASDRVSRAREQMKLNGIHHLPVVDAQGDLVGVIARSDIRVPSDWPHAASWFDLVPVSDVMIPSPVTIEPWIGIHRAANIMRRRRIGCAPVIVNHQLVGIVTRSDLLGLVGQEAN